MKTYSFKTPAEVAATFGCSEKQAREQIMRCRAGIIAMLLRARHSGKKVNGYTEAELEQMNLAYNRALAV